jgi:hypothetical protein
MTALTRYVRLEARGLWRDLPEAQRREVVVKLGDQSLVLADPLSEVPLTHWSLPAVVRRGAGEGGGTAVIFAPGEEAAETLEIDDAEMIAALDTLRAAVAQARPRPGRLRGAILVGLLAAVVGVTVFALPDAIVAHALRVLPPATRAAIGAAVLGDLVQVTGAPCAMPAGQAALDRLGQRLFGSAAPTLRVLREGVPGALILPDGTIVLAEAVIATADGPEPAAGFALVAAARGAAADPMDALLRDAGPVAALRLLATGALPDEAVRGYAPRLIAAPPPALDPQALLERFRAAGVPAAPYAWAEDPSGETTLALIEADPFPQGAPEPLLADADWLQLQDICTR